jgi:hypothetical protein
VAQLDPIASFTKKTISYTYDNEWSFTNTFEGHTRISVVPRRGELREHVEMRELRPGLFLASWIDDEMGLLAQIIDLENGTVLPPSRSTTTTGPKSSAARSRASTSDHSEAPATVWRSSPDMASVWAPRPGFCESICGGSGRHGYDICVPIRS